MSWCLEDFQNMRELIAAAKRIAARLEAESAAHPAPPAVASGEGRSLGAIAAAAWNGATDKTAWDQVAQAVRAAVLAEVQRELTPRERARIWGHTNADMETEPTHKFEWLAEAMRKADALRGGRL